MKLSIIVVNHYKSLLLKQTLNSLVNAAKNIDYELIVINNSLKDGSLEMLQSSFPNITLISNETDFGIAKANNQALKISNGEYVLLVNPDTICVDGSLEKMISFMDAHTDAGGLDIRMITPDGRFLPESKHGITKPWITFFKFIGFAKHLSKTRLYNRNIKDWVEEFQISEVDLLNGACMLLRRSVLNLTGLFDERFFMYGHDIDLSYRIRLAGYKNYYFPKTYVINFDSQHMAKFSWNYIKYFYGAMFIFAFKYLLKMPEIKLGIPQLSHSSYGVK
ncbi:MAG TPA: glycosyltransferase family 2 protein [Mucilaginibacter sp.]|jgi:GT2 family glycosyltransferase